MTKKLRVIKHKYSYSAFRQDIEKMGKEIKKNGWEIKYVYGPPRGGAIIAVMLSHLLNIKYLPTLEHHHHIRCKTLIVDDVSDTGNTLNKIPNIKSYKVATLFVKPQTTFIPNIYINQVSNRTWIDYWWEVENY